MVNKKINIKKENVKRLFFAIVMITIMAVVTPVYAGDDRAERGGLFSEGSFFSDAISSVTGKLDKMASGEERLVDDNAKGIGKDDLEYDGDALGRPRVKPSSSDFRNSRRRAGQGQAQE